MVETARGIKGNTNRTIDEITRDNFRYQAQMAANTAYLLSSYLNTHSLHRTKRQENKVLNCIDDLRDILDDIEQNIEEDEREIDRDYGTN